MKRLLAWFRSFSTHARGIALNLEASDRRYPSTAKESLFAFPWGLRVELNVGRVVRPVLNPKRIVMERVAGFPWLRLSLPNPWTDAASRLFVLRLPPLPCPFLSLKLWNNWGFYVGFKPYTVSKDGRNPRYGWARPDEHGNIYLCPSFSIRRTAVD